MGAMIFKDAAEFSGEKILILAGFDHQDTNSTATASGARHSPITNAVPIQFGRARNHARIDQVANARVGRPTDGLVGML